MTFNILYILYYLFNLVLGLACYVTYMENNSCINSNSLLLFTFLNSFLWIVLLIVDFLATLFQIVFPIYIFNTNKTKMHTQYENNFLKKSHEH